MIICVYAPDSARDGRQTTLSIGRAGSSEDGVAHEGGYCHIGGECEQAYASLSRRLRTMLVDHRRARAAGQQLAWMMSVHAELERIGGERKVSLVKKRPAQHDEQEVLQHVEPAVQRQLRTLHRTNIDVQFHGHGVSLFISDFAMVFDVSEDTGCNGARSSSCDEGARQ